MASVEYQHVIGEWRITDYDSPDDVDALPETNTLKGRVRFLAKWDELDRFATIRVPEDGVEPSFQLSVREMVFAVVGGRLQDREARDGVMLPAVAGGVPIAWTAIPELYEDPGRGVNGPAVSADAVSFGPPEPDVDGNRVVNLADVVNGDIVYPDPIVSQVAALVQDAETARTGAETAAANASSSADTAAGHAAAALASAGAASDSETAAAGSASTAGGHAAAALASENAAAGSATAAGGSATAAADSATDSANSATASADSATDSANSATAAGASETNAAGSATTAGGHVTAAAGHAADALAQADRAFSEADRAQAAADQAATGAPVGGWTETNLAASVNASLDLADTALQSLPAHEHTMVEVTGLSAALDDKADAADLTSGLAGKADLVGGMLVTSQIPAVAISSRTVVADRAGLLALTAQEGDVGIISSGADRGSYILGSGPATDFASWALMVAPDDAVASVNGQIGAVNLDAADVGAAPATHTHTIVQVTGLQTELDNRAESEVVDVLPGSGVTGRVYFVREA